MSPEPALLPWPLLVYLLVILGGGVIALILDLLGDARQQPMRLPSWNLGWLNFGLMLWCLLVGSVLVQSLVASALSINREGLNTSHALAQGLTFHLTALAIILVVAFHPAIQPKLRLSPHPCRTGSLLTSTLIGFFGGLLLALVTAHAWSAYLQSLVQRGVLDAAPVQPLVTLFSESAPGPELVMLAFLAIILAPVTEELIFRVGLYRFLKGRFSARFALVTSSLLFACMHFNSYSFIPLFLLGLLLCRSYEKSGDVRVPIAFHALFNANNILLIMLLRKLPEDSPMEVIGQFLLLLLTPGWMSL